MQFDKDDDQTPCRNEQSSKEKFLFSSWHAKSEGQYLWDLQKMKCYFLEETAGCSLFLLEVMVLKLLKAPLRPFLSSHKGKKGLHLQKIALELSLPDLEHDGQLRLLEHLSLLQL